MKKILQIVGILSIIIGIVLGAVEITNSFLDKSSIVYISNILERKIGIEYSNVKTGSVYPCKLEITYKDNSGKKQIGKTSYETEPCSKIFTTYYKVGDRVNIVYSKDNPSSIKINGLMDRFGFLILFPLFGLGLIYFSKRLH